MTRLVPVADYDRALARAELAEAHRAEALLALRALVRQLERIGGYSTPQDQQALRDARALLVESP